MLYADGSVWATGSNVHGQLGDMSTNDRSRFTKVVPSTTKVKVVAAGVSHSMILAQDGCLWATGWNLFGQFGDGSMTSTRNFIRVPQIIDNQVHRALTQAVDLVSSDVLMNTRASDRGEKRVIGGFTFSLALYAC